MARRPIGKPGAIGAKQFLWTFAISLLVITNFLQVARASIRQKIQVASNGNDFKFVTLDLGLDRANGLRVSELIRREENEHADKVKHLTKHLFNKSLQVPTVIHRVNPKSKIINSKASDRPPPVSGTPDGRQPAGTRGGCEIKNKTDTPFTPLLPVTNSGFSGFTLNEYPTIWFYIGYNTRKVSSGKFTLSLEGQQNNQIFQTDVKLPETSGFVSVTLPQTEKPLEKNQQYRWNFRLYCSSEDPSLAVYHTGTVQRVDLPGLESQLKTATLAQGINLYIQNRIWYDASTDLAKIHDLPQAWLNLFKAIGLENLDREAIAGTAVPSDSGN